jgi:hypothetical protein
VYSPASVISRPVALHDVHDAQAFVAANIHRSGVILHDRDEREELLAEGLAILCELAGRFEPHREGYAQAGSFAGYASKYLPGRMRDAYHALHPEYLPTRTDGRRTYDYETVGHPMSLHHEDMPQLPATPIVLAPTSIATGWDPGPTIAAALARAPAEYFMARRVVERIDEGFTPDEIARSLRMNRGEVSRTTAAVASALYEVQHLAEAA